MPGQLPFAEKERRGALQHGVAAHYFLVHRRPACRFQKPSATNNSLHPSAIIAYLHPAPGLTHGLTHFDRLVDASGRSLFQVLQFALKILLDVF